MDTMIGKENLTPFAFLEEAQKVLQDLFTQYPPEDQDLVDLIVAIRNGQTERLQEKRDNFFLKPLMNKDDIAKKLDWLSFSVEKTPKLEIGLVTCVAEFLNISLGWIYLFKILFFYWNYFRDTIFVICVGMIVSCV